MLIYSLISIAKNLSPFDIQNATQFILRYGYLLLLNLLSIAYINKLNTLKTFLRIIIIFNLIEIFLIFIGDYSKFLLVITGFIFICFYYVYYLVISEINEAYNQSGIHKNDLHANPITTLKVTIKLEDQVEYEGQLTNCSDAGFFMVFKNLPDNLAQKKIAFKIEFEGTFFEGYGQVVSVSKYFQGIGVKYSKDVKVLNTFQWLDLVEVLKNRKIHFWGLV